MDYQTLKGQIISFMYGVAAWPSIVETLLTLLTISAALLQLHSIGVHAQDRVRLLGQQHAARARNGLRDRLATLLRCYVGGCF